MIFYLLTIGGFLLGATLAVRSSGWVDERWEWQMVDNPNWKPRSKESRKVMNHVLVKPAHFDRRDVSWVNSAAIAVAGSLGGFLVYIMVGAILSITIGHPVLERHVPLSALSTSSQTEGRFFLGSGKVDEVPSFSYITSEAGGAHHLDTADASKSTIFETGNDDAYLDVIVQRLDGLIWGPFNMDTRTTYEFHIPAGSIVSDYTVSAG